MITTREGQRNLLRKEKLTDRRYIPRVPILIGVVLSGAIALVIAKMHGFLDLEVYRVGTRAWLESGVLYGPILEVQGHTDLPFTYPPTAAVLMIPLAVMPLWLAELAVTASSLACLGVTVWLVLSRVRPDLELRTKATVTTTAVVALLAFEPFRLTLWFGQINLVLLAAVTLDCLAVKTRWPRGMLIGIAAVVKLIPAAFVLYFLLRRDWKAAGTAAATSAIVVLAGFLFFPQESSKYWFHTVGDTNRIGTPYYVGNQSIKGAVLRLGLPDGASTVVWLGIGVLIVGVGAALMHYLFAAERAADPRVPARVTLFSVIALLANAAVVLLISPVSWTHHWVWAGVALVAVGAWTTANPGRKQFALAGGFALMFLIGPGIISNGGDREFNWSWWQHLLGDGYVVAAIVLLAVGLGQMLRLRARQARLPAPSAA